MLTLDEMPDLRNYVTAIDEKRLLTTAKTRLLTAFPSVITDNLTILSNSAIQKVAVFTMSGAEVRQFTVPGVKAVVPFTGIRAGTYIVKVDENQAIRVLKQ